MATGEKFSFADGGRRKKPSQNAGQESEHTAGFKDELAEIRRQLDLLMQGQVETQGAVERVHEHVVATLGQPRSDVGQVVDPNLLGCASISSIEEEPAGVVQEEVREQGKSDSMLSRRSSRASPVQSMGPKDRSATQMATLAGMLSTAEEESLKRYESMCMRRSPLSYFISKVRGLSWEECEAVLDSIMGIFILLNSVFIGLSMDNRTPGFSIWLVIDIAFSLLFLFELALKIRIRGLHGQFCGPGAASNIFDASLIIADVTQLLILLFIPMAADMLAGTPSASLFRIVRLVKLARLVRLLRGDGFRDLISMLSGLIGGLSTLFWTVVLFLAIVYVMALVFRELLGRDESEHISVNFDTVPKSMFTTFRCSFGDCSNAAGVSIFEFVTRERGFLYGLIYCLFMFIVTIGVFNVISAIFVESTMEAASAVKEASKVERLADKVRWSTSISILISKLMEYSNTLEIEGNLSEHLGEIFSTEVKGTEIDRMVKDTEVKSALMDLDIDPHDHQILSDILDPENTGTVLVRDLVDGLRRLRGDPRRSDIVSVDLMIRSMQMVLGVVQEQVSEIHSLVKSAHVVKLDQTGRCHI